MHLNLVQIQTTSYCNARCDICPYKDSWMIKNPGVMSLKDYEDVLRKVSEADESFSGKVCPYLMNEPFTDKYLDKRIYLIYKYLPNAEVEISTNAELMKGSLMKRVIDTIKSHNKNPLTKIKVSLHGSSIDEISNLMHIDGNTAVKNTVEMLKYNDGNIPVVLVGLGQSRDEQIRLFNYRKLNRFWHRILEENNVNRRNVRILYYSFHNRAGNVEYSGWNYPKKIREIGPSNPFDCPRIHGRLHILWNLDVLLCCMDYNHEYCLGNLKDSSVEELLESEQCQTIYKMVRGEIESPEDFICKRCMSPGG
ncbi:MAG: hypothetical protein DRI61_03105 [Chloroflexi bacterium]|nr:MAG: hypothetical protein DRI61_03105 [Chloroflexota bacterium]